MARKPSYRIWVPGRTLVIIGMTSEDMSEDMSGRVSDTRSGSRSQLQAACDGITSGQQLNGWCKQRR